MMIVNNAFDILDDSNVSSDGKIPVKIGGLPVTMVIDSGASCTYEASLVRSISLHGLFQT